jgi:hypothetical protein
MAISLFHQCGHNTSWNVEALTRDKVGDGLIISPVHYNMQNVVKLTSKIKKASLFDPQYYLPNSQKSKLNTYPFFPERLLGGFSTTNFPQFAQESANRCVRFQLEQEFQRIVIPARYFSQMLPDYRERQESYTVAPFLNAIRTQVKKKDVFLTLPLTSHMLEHRGYRTEILNWVTSFPEINGVYLIVENERTTKQIQDRAYLASYLDFLSDLRSADLEVLAGYLNTEALLVAAFGDYDLTFGTFENTRMFSVDKFLTTEEDRRGPRPRIYLPGLLNWIQFDQAKQIQKSAPQVWRKVYKETEYAESTLRAEVEPYFNQPELYKHFFICFNEQMKALKSLGTQDRIKTLLGWVASGIANYQEIARAGVLLEVHGNGEHLPAWRSILSSH